MYADDVVLLSSSEKGLQNCINKLANFATDWKMSLNTKKTKVMVFTKSGRYKTFQMKYLDNLIDNVKQYTYLGIVFYKFLCNFTVARKEILNKGMKTLFKLKKNIFTGYPRS
jgi:hypothetical protein